MVHHQRLEGNQRSGWWWWWSTSNYQPLGRRITSIKQKAALFLSLLLVLYLYLFLGDHSNALMRHIKVLASSLADGDLQAVGGGSLASDHRLGQLVSHPNGSFLNFHLPSLTDYPIERDFYRVKSSSIRESTTTTQYYCLRAGTDEVLQQAGEVPLCVCKDDYAGAECAIPPLVHRTVPSQSPKSKGNSSQFSRLRRPRRLLVSLIWPTYSLTVVGNGTELAVGKRARLQRLAQAMTLMAAYVDLFVLHELRIDFEGQQQRRNGSEEEPPEDQDSLEYQLAKGDRLLGRHSPYSLLFSSRVSVPTCKKQEEEVAGENLQVFDLTAFEAAAARKSWHLFASQVTEYRPADLLLFLAAGNLPSTSLLRFLKYHSGLADVTHLLPLYRLKLAYTTDADYLDGQDKADLVANNDSLSSTLGGEKSFSSATVEAVPLALSGNHHLANVLFSFELMTYLCRYNVDHFLASYCLTGQSRSGHLLDRFQRHFWPVRLGSVGSSSGSGSGNLSATFSIARF